MEHKTIPYDFLVHTQMLRPGDVILTLGTEKSSNSIAKTTNSQFSHASLVVSGDTWFEADEAGVGYSRNFDNSGWLERKKNFGPIIGLENCKRAVVLRHPALAELEAEAVENEIRKIVTQWDGLDYSDYRRLAKPLAISGKQSTWARFCLWLQQKKDPRSSDGLFCSEVVAKVFAHLESKFGSETALFGATRNADYTHPGHLANSRLQVVSGAIEDPLNLPPSAQIKWNTPLGLGRRWPTENARVLLSTERLYSNIDETLRMNEERLLEELRCGYARVEHKLRATAKSLEVIGADEAAHQARELLSQFERQCQLLNSKGIDTQQMTECMLELGEVDLRAKEIQVFGLEELLMLDPPNPLEHDKQSALIQDARNQLESASLKLAKIRERTLRKLDEISSQSEISAS